MLQACRQKTRDRKLLYKISSSLFTEFDAAPIVNTVVADIFQTCSRCGSDEHRHILHIESADEQKTSLADGVSIGLHILDKDVAVYIGKENIICVSLQE
jgi:hypothetical protein